MDESRYLTLLIGAKASVSLSALEKPSGTDAFHYGHAAGVIKGLNIAIELLKEQLADDKEDKL